MSIKYEIHTLHSNVTGSCIPLTFHLKTGIKKIVIDCGLFQNEDEKTNNFYFPFSPKNIDYVLITHNHADHIARVPLLVKKGYAGNIYCTNITAKLNSLSLKHMAKKYRDSNLDLYTRNDIEKTLRNVRGIDYNQKQILDENFSITFLGNNHMLGASCILLQVNDEDERLNFLFTGDYNNKNELFKAPDIPDYVKELELIIFQESTYGNSFSSGIKMKYDDDIIRMLERNMTIIHPANTCERIEQILLRLKKLQSNGSISSDTPIFVDSPLGIDYIILYSKLCDVNFIPKNLFLVDPKNKKMHNKKGSLKDVKYISEIPLDDKPKIIIVSSGSADYGKAPYYISKLANREDVTIYFSSYIPDNSLGKRIINAKKGDELKINVFGKKVYINLNCNVEITNEFSSHARSDELLNFLKMFKNIKAVFLNHGEGEIKKAYEKMIRSNLSLSHVYILERKICYIMKNFNVVNIINSKFDKYVNSRRKG